MASVRCLKLVFATKQNIKPYGHFISDDIGESRLDIPFYGTINEGDNINATWKDTACVRMSKIYWRDDFTVTWLERHMEMTQGFIVTGHNPGLFVLGEPTHERVDLDECQKMLPDVETIKAFIIPAGHGVIIHKGTWHDFPVSCGPPVTCFLINTEEVVAALTACEEPRPMNEGDCLKLRLSEHWNFELHFQDPRRFVKHHGLLRSSLPVSEMGDEGYGHLMKRNEVELGWAGGESVYVIPVVNVEVFKPGCGGPGIQPHLKSCPEIANKGWRDYGNLRGIQRLSKMFRSLDIQATAVINSDATFLTPVRDAILMSGWDLGAHGLNNSDGNAGMTRKEEEEVFARCTKDITTNLGVQPKSWLTPGFSVTERTAEIASASGFDVYLDNVDDDVPYLLQHASTGSEILCLPYCLETNDFSLVMTKNFDGRQYAQAIEDHVRMLASEKGENVVCLGMHTFVAGTPANVYALSQMFERLKTVKGVKFATAAQVSDLIRNSKNNHV